jgi:hypothetical protein
MKSPGGLVSQTGFRHQTTIPFAWRGYYQLVFVLPELGGYMWMAISSWITI